MTPFMKIEMFETKNHWTFMTINRIRGYPKTLILGVIKGGGPLPVINGVMGAPINGQING